VVEKLIHTRIKLLTFDLDDTLWPCKPTIIAAENRLYEWMQQRVPQITERHDNEALLHKRRDFMQRRPDLLHDMSKLRIESLKALSDEIGLEYDWIEEAFEVFFLARQQVDLYSDVAPALDRLSTEYTLVAVTNGNADISLTGVDRWFNFSVSAADVGHQKPHPLVFQTAMAKAGVAPDETVHIGDDEQRDIFGASEAGIRTVWLNRSDRDWNHTECEADHHIRSLAELPEILRNMQYNVASE
jgi:putative hydrolase of the HAD superfamily